ncbi:Coenzyme F420 hydrogenase/dehydrogenase, beta subunit C-terminal domain [Candidatus Latescibacterota bacterium]
MSVFHNIKNIQDVVDWGMCVGCGTCFAACNKDAVSLVNIESVGIRPKFNITICSFCNECLSICPGYIVDGDMVTGERPMTKEADIEFGPTLEIWEGYAVDPEIRFKGSSGGVLSALSLYCLENENMDFVLHAGMDNEHPWENKTYQSRTRTDISARTGSRYAPASPCEGLKYIEKNNRQCVFIGKPCDVAGVTMLRRQRPLLDRNIGLVLGFFCAGQPSTQGTLDIIKLLDINKKDINELRYRGEGWPGNFKVIYSNYTKESQLSYKDSWGKLNKYCSFRCRICPDGLGRTADISCGDAWDLYSGVNNQGHSIVFVRTNRGQKILHRAIDANYIELKQVSSNNVLEAQINLLGKRKDIFGRILAMKLLFIPTPKYKGFSLFRSWFKLPIFHKVRSILGTLRRLVQRDLWHQQRYFINQDKFKK